MDIGAPELVIVLVILLVLFGGRKIPEMARSLGRAQHEFRAGLEDGTNAGDPAAPAVSADPASPAVSADPALPAVPGEPAVPQSDEPGANPH